MNHPSQSEAPSIADNFNNPVLTAEQALQGVLRLLEGLHHNSELDDARVKAATGIQLLSISQESKTFEHAFSAKLTSQWDYRMFLYQNLGDTNRTFRFSFNETPAFLEKTPPLTGICKLDLDQFHAALLQMGYKHVSSMRRSNAGRQYERGAVRVNVEYYGESNERVSHKCVKTIYIN